VPLSARDKKALLALIEKAQLVYLLTRYPKKQVLDDAGDVGKLETGLDEMRAAAKDLSAKIREDHALVRWDELAKEPDSPELAWRVAKRVTPTVIRELMPLLEGEPEAAFFLRPEAPEKKANAKTKTKPRPRKATSRRAR
jgi:hypothetical protein